MLIAQRTMRGSLTLTKIDGVLALREKRTQTIERHVPISMFTGDRVDEGKYPEVVTKHLMERGILVKKEMVRDEADNEVPEDLTRRGETEVSTGLQSGQTGIISAETVAGAPSGKSNKPISFDD